MCRANFHQPEVTLGLAVDFVDDRERHDVGARHNRGEKRIRGGAVLRLVDRQVVPHAVRAGEGSRDITAMPGHIERLEAAVLSFKNLAWGKLLWRPAGHVVHESLAVLSLVKDAFSLAPATAS